MAYKDDIPLITDQLSDSQADMAENFLVLDNGFSVNHIGFNGSNYGFHSFVEFLKQDFERTEVGDLHLTIRKDDEEDILCTAISTNQAATTSKVIFRYGESVLSVGDTTTVSLVNSETEAEMTKALNAQVTVVGDILTEEIPTVVSLSETALVIQNNGNSGKTIYYFVIGY